MLLKCICVFLKYDEGEILFKRRKIGKDMTMIQNAGAIIEEPAFYGSGADTVIWNIFMVSGILLTANIYQI